jgi:tetratricopeptide (TPR) repeat protein
MAESPSSHGEESYWFKRGNELLSLGQYLEALDSYDRAIKINSKDSDVWNNKGMVLCALGLFEDAVWSFEKALEINPRNAHAWHNKGVALSRLGRDAEARFAISCAGWIGMHEI